MQKKARMTLSKLLSFTKSSNAMLFLTIELILGVALITTSLVAFADIAKDTFIDKEVVVFDTAVSQVIQSVRTPLLTEFMLFISLLGADGMLLIAAVLCIILVWKHHRKEALIFILTLLLGTVLNLLLKELFQRPRPSVDPLIEISFYSFPSGHAMNSFVFYATFAYFAFHFTRNITLSLWTTFICGLLILFIGISRIYLGVHYPSDVIAGYIAGLFWFVFVLFTERTILFLKLFREFKKK